MAKWSRNTAIPQDITVNVDTIYTTMIIQFDDQMREQRKRKSLYPRRNINVSYTHLTLANARTLWQFYQARDGRFETFFFVLPYWDTYVGEYIGTGDGSTVFYDLPSENISNETVYIAGAETSSYAITAGIGADSNDRIRFDSAPADGDRLTIDFTGNLVVVVRFEEDVLTFQRMWDKFTTIGINLHGLLWDEKAVTGAGEP